MVLATLMTHCGASKSDDPIDIKPENVLLEPPENWDGLTDQGTNRWKIITP